MPQIFVFPVKRAIPKLKSLDKEIDSLNEKELYNIFSRYVILKPESRDYLLSRALSRISRIEGNIVELLSSTRLYIEGERVLPGWLTKKQIANKIRTNYLLSDVMRDVISLCGFSSDWIQNASDDQLLIISQLAFSRMSLEEQFGKQESYKFPIRQLALSAYNSMIDVLNLDTLFLESQQYLAEELFIEKEISYYDKSKLVAIILIDDNKMYSGHIYSWTFKDNKDIIGMIGIRSSVRQQLARKCRASIPNIAFEFINVIKTWAKMNDAKYIFVEQPLGPMPKILEKCGFQILDEYTRKKWLSYQDVLFLTSVEKPSYFLDLNKEPKTECQSKIETITFLNN